MNRLILKIKMKFTEQRQKYIPEHASRLINYSTVIFLWQKCFLFNNFEFNFILIKSVANVRKL